MIKTYVGVLKKYADFSGRARPGEFWTFFLLNGALIISLAVPGGVFFKNTDVGNFFFGLSGAMFLGTLIPFYAVATRRLHDTGRSGFWIFIKFIPYIGGLVLLILLALEGERGPNKYGKNPTGTLEKGQAELTRFSRTD